MKTYLVVLTALSLSSAWLSTANVKPIPTHRGSFAVVELFTSEGCSSCPPAERVLNQINEEQTAKGEPVYVLSFHVDYWNRLGWTDPFSDTAFSDRQRDYAVAFRSRSIYTPQMVVNGQAEFVGSDKSQAKRRIEQALSTSTAGQVGIGLAAHHDQTANQANISWQLDRLPEGAVLNIAVVEDDLGNYVPRGENRGQTLEHDGVVRVFVTLTPEAVHGSLNVSLPPDLDPTQSGIIAFVQETRGMHIIGAYRVPLAQP
ncbi:MAG: DUF1223 domain-containing protein [Planctomycetota bacterium]